MGETSLTMLIMSLTDFISRCDRFCADTGKSRAWVSKRLFNDHDRIEQIASGKSDVGVRRLEAAVAALAELETANDAHGAAA